MILSFRENVHLKLHSRRCLARLCLSMLAWVFVMHMVHGDNLVVD